MSDFAVFHSSEFDESPDAGWYICRCFDDGPVADDAAGPFQTERQAFSALRSGAWIREWINNGR